MNFGFTVNAQVCKISQSNDSVEIFSCSLDDNSVKVTVANDSNDISANVTVVVQVDYSAGKKMEYTGKCIASPNSTTEIVIPIDKYYNNSQSYPARNATVLSISGTKCLQ